MRSKTIVVACGLVGIVVVATLLYFVSVQPVSGVRITKTFNLDDCIYSGSDNDYYFKGFMSSAENSSCVLIVIARHFRYSFPEIEPSYRYVSYCPGANNTFSLDYHPIYLPYGRIFSVLNVDLGNTTITLSWVEKR